MTSPNNIDGLGPPKKFLTTFSEWRLRVKPFRRISGEPPILTGCQLKRKRQHFCALTAEQQEKKNKLCQYQAQLSQHFLCVPRLLKPSLRLYRPSPSFPPHLSFIPTSANSLCCLGCALISGWEIFRDLGHSDLTGSYSQQV